MKTLIRTLLAAVVLAGGGLAIAAPAGADTGDQRPCVTNREYNRISKGMTKARVQDIFDTKGTFLFRNPGYVHNEAKEYRGCSGYIVQVQYNNYAAKGGPQRVVLKQTY